jgi:hypothetical protein
LELHPRDFERPGVNIQDNVRNLRPATIFLGLAASAALALSGAGPDRPPQAAGGAPKGALKHPYLHFSANNLPELRARVSAAPFSKRWASIQAHANRCLSAGPAGGAGMIRTRVALGICVNTAFAYAITGDRKYADRAKKEAFSLLEGPRWMEAAHARIVTGADLCTAEGSVACALVYDWCFDAMTADEQSKFRDLLVQKSLAPYLKSVAAKDWWLSSTVSNWTGTVNGGCGLAALALHGEVPDAPKAAEAAWTYVQKFARDLYLADGDCHEGVMYSRNVFTFYFATAAARFFGGDGGLFDDLTKKLAGYWDIGMQGPDFKYANFNDMDEGCFAGLWGQGGRVEGGPSGELCALFEAKVPGGDPMLLWAADNGGCFFSYDGASPFSILWRRDAPPAGPKPHLQDAILFRGSGHVVWQSPQLWFAYNGGWISDKSHHNFDLGTFVLVAGGERFVNDPGYGKTATGEHSTIVVNGRDQILASQGTYLRYGSGKTFHYFASDLTASCKELKKWVRHGVMVRGSYLVLLDDLATAPAAEIEWRLQTRAKIDLVPSERRALLAGAKESLQVVAAHPADAQVSQGKATLPFVSINPGASRPAEAIVTVLWPGKEGVRASFDKGTLTLTHAGGKDTLAFAPAGPYWVLSSVNGESAVSIGPPKERVLKPFRR